MANMHNDWTAKKIDITRAIREATFSELLTKQAMKKVM
jgi:hypothetical protein